jgi:hypothetical protein
MGGPYKVLVSSVGEDESSSALGSGLHSENNRRRSFRREIEFSACEDAQKQLRQIDDLFLHLNEDSLAADAASHRAVHSSDDCPKSAEK